MPSSSVKSIDGKKAVCVSENIQTKAGEACPGWNNVSSPDYLTPVSTAIDTSGHPALLGTNAHLANGST